MYSSEDVNDLLKKNEVKEYRFNIIKFKVKAPVHIGDKIGTLEVLDNENKVIKTIDLISKEEIKKHNFLSLFKEFFKLVTLGSK